MKEEIRFMCCFCEKKEMSEPEITIIDNETGQNWWSHKTCFESKIKKHRT